MCFRGRGAALKGACCIVTSDEHVDHRDIRAAAQNLFDQCLANETSASRNEHAPEAQQSHRHHRHRHRRRHRQGTGTSTGTRTSTRTTHIRMSICGQESRSVQAAAPSATERVGASVPLVVDTCDQRGQLARQRGARSNKVTSTPRLQEWLPPAIFPSQPPARTVTGWHHRYPGLGGWRVRARAHVRVRVHGWAAFWISRVSK